MRRAPKVLVFVALVTVLGLLPAHAEPTAPFQLEARVPASTLAFVSVEDVGSAEERMNATSLGKIANDPEMKAFLAPIEEAATEMLEGGALEIPPMVTDLLEQMQGLQGQLALALVDVDMENEWLSAAASLDFGTNSKDFVTFLMRVKSELDPEGELVETLEKDGRTWWKMAVPDAPGSVFATTVDTAFVIASDESLLTSILAGASDGVLAQDEDFLATQRKLGGKDLALLAYLNVDAALVRFAEMLPPDAQQIGNALGLDTIRSVAYGMAFSGDGFRDTFLLHAPGADHGLVPLLTLKPMTAPKTLDMVPAGAFYWEEGNVPMDDLIARVRTIVGAIDPDMTEEMDKGLEQVSQMLGVDVENELLGGLAGNYGQYASFPATGGLYPEIAVVLEVKDAAVYEGVFDRLAQGVAGLLNEEGDVIAGTRSMDYHGVTMHLFEMQAARGDDPVPFTPTWALLGNRLVITLVPHAMKEIILRAEGETAFTSLASKEDFRSLLSLKPGRAGAMAYVDLKSGFSLLYDTIVPLLQTVAKPNVLEDLPFPLDWALLPPASRIVKHFSSLATYATWDQDGIALSVQGPVPMFPIMAVAAGAGMFLAFSGSSSAMAPSFAVEPEIGLGMGSDLEAEMDLELAQIQGEMLLDAVALYRMEKNGWPDTLEAVVEAGFLNAVPKDPWGGSYRLLFAGPGMDPFVVSAGPDEEFSTEDDVKATQAAE